MMGEQGWSYGFKPLVLSFYVKFELFYRERDLSTRMIFYLFSSYNLLFLWFGLSALFYGIIQTLMCINF